ncbi:MAG: hypothetical protein JO041_03975 [Acidobacteria bacterium]|nr:hypothetical protein [Acidobacteriota bacterium]
MPMITREALIELAEFRADEESALSFYFQPQVPADKSHRDELILVRDMVKELARPPAKGGGPSARDLERLLVLGGSLARSHSQAKAVFACERHGIWREFDLPAGLRRTELMVNRRFHLRPFIALMGLFPRTLAALMDRKRARIFEVWMHQAKQIDDLVDELPRRGRSDGWAGYDGGHAERHVENEAMRHFKRVADRALERYGGSGFQGFAVGCRDEIWSEVESQVHPYLRESLIGRFNLDVATATGEQVREHVERLVAEHAAERRQGMVREVLGEAQRNGRGAAGLRPVLGALERGEVQALLVGETLGAQAMECTHCGHLETRTAPECELCGSKMREIEDVADALVGLALRSRAELVYLAGDREFEQAGNVAAMLRFRADQNTPARIAG